MRNKQIGRGYSGRLMVRLFPIGCALLLSACASLPPGDGVVLRAVDLQETAAYSQALHRMTPQEMGRERQQLMAQPVTPETQIRLAMLLGYPRGPQDLSRAITMLDAVLKSSDPAAVSLHPLAYLLLDNYAERQKLHMQLDRQGQQLKEAQRRALELQGKAAELESKAAELQGKLDSLADIERTLPQRPGAGRPHAPGGGR